MLKIKSINELEKVSEDNKWLIKGFWLTKGIGILAAQPKSGKSWLALDMAVSLASGKKCLDFFEVGSPHKVLFFNAEDTQAIQRERFELVKAAKGINEELPNLGIMVSEEGLRLDQEEGILALRDKIIEFKPELLILDPWVRLQQVSENNATGVAKILAELRKIKNEFGCGILLVHHAAKGSKDIRGSTEFPAWGETNLFMYRDSKENLKLDIQHRAAESVDGLNLRIGKLNEGVTIRVIKDEEKEEKIVNKVEKVTLLSERFSLNNLILNKLSSLNPTTMAELEQKLASIANRVELSSAIQQLLYKGAIYREKGNYYKKVS